MFNYYGSKSKIVHKYPAPKYPVIIEPFAGSAQYSCRWWNRDVRLFDIDDDVAAVWQYLIGPASIDDFQSIPIFKKGDSVLKYKHGLRHSTTANQKIDAIATKLKIFKHWQFTKCPYYDIQNQEATWFIDPPYQYGGEHYRHGNKSIDFAALAEWCMSRRGQVIVCENTKADWMPFRPLVRIRGLKYSTTEAIWTND